MTGIGLPRIARNGALETAAIRREAAPAGRDGFGAWIEAQDHRPAANPWEIDVKGSGPGPDLAAWRTELNRPIMI